MIKGVRLIDSHVHFGWPVSAGSLTAALSAEQADAVCLLALPNAVRLSAAMDVLAYKHQHPETTFAFACLDCSAYGTRRSLGSYMVKYAKRMLAAGCDGVKLLEGKPTMRRAFPIPDFDAPVWEPFWAFAEETRLPITWHVNDPAIYWDPARLPEAARLRGWGYGKDDIDNEAQYRQVRTVLERHPQLNVTFAHMFFLAGRLVRLGEWLERFPNMHVDLTPGIELYEELSRAPGETRAFFDRFSARIQYGTDIGSRAVIALNRTAISENESRLRARYAQTFLTEKTALGVRADGEYLIGTEPFVLHGLGLPKELLERVLGENFLSFVGSRTPRPVDAGLCVKECKKLRRAIADYAELSGAEADLRAVEAAERYFSLARTQHARA